MSLRNRLTCILLTAACGTLGCNGDELGEENPNQSPKSTCSNPLPSVHASAIDYPGRNYFQYTARFSSNEVYDYLTIVSRKGEGFYGPTEPGRHGIAGRTFADCDLCVYAGKNCEEGGACETYFFADQGTVNIVSFGEETFEAKFESLRLVESTYDGSNLNAVEDGEIWCMPEEGSISADYVVKVPEPVCVAEGNGAFLNDNIADFALPNCNGDLVNLHEGCGTTKVMWVVATASWCPACTQWLDEYVLPNYDNLKNSGLDLFIVLGEDEYYNKPNADDCYAYAEKHDLDPAMVVMDHDGTQALATLVDKIQPYSGGGMIPGWPWNAILRGSNMEYLYSDSSTGGNELADVVNMLLAE